MCGIIGYKGKGNASVMIIEGLKRMEYRGYDSWGIGLGTGRNIDIVKDVGKISDANQDSSGTSGIGIGHTRWATTGAVTRENAHPHPDCTGKIAVVHNGIIQNHELLRRELAGRGHKFISETDTEVMAHLIEENIGLGLREAAMKAMKMVEGRNAFVVMNENELCGFKKGSPLVVGIGKNEFFVASDITAFLERTRRVVYMEDNELVDIMSEPKYYDALTGASISKEAQSVAWTGKQATKEGYEHFLIKEISEQPKTIMESAVQDDREIKLIADRINNAYGAFLVACGTAGYAALAGQYFFSKIARKHINQVIASEFAGHKYFLTDKSLVIAVSQSGESADVLEAVEAAKEKHSRVIGVCNVPGSALVRKSDFPFLTRAGPELAVISTKAYTAQLSLLLLLAYACAGKLDDGKRLLSDAAEKAKALVNDDMKNRIRALAEGIKDSEHIYVIGKGFNYPTALEAALKIKEASYIHAEGFASGELKHGVIALIDKGTPCIAFVANDETKQDVIAGAEEVKARGGHIIGICPENHEVFDRWIAVPDCGDASPIINVIPAQLLAYYLAVSKGLDPDRPRNLAKSVTVK